MSDQPQNPMAEVVSRLTLDEIKAIIKAAMIAIDNMMVHATSTNVPAVTGDKNYNANEFINVAPKAGWLTVDELNKTHMAMTEAIASENWVKGIAIAVAFLSLVGAL
jgi:hypothetical protein